MSTEKLGDINVHCLFDEIKDVAELVPNPRNPNTHSMQQIELLSKLITYHGWRAPVVVSNRSGFIVSGHGRYEAARLLDDSRVPVVSQDFETEADEWAHLIADNQISELSSLSESKLAELIEDLDKEGINLDMTGFDSSEIEQLLMNSDLVPNDDGDITVSLDDDEDDDEAVDGVRMVQLYYADETYHEFIAALDACALEFETQNATDTVLQALKHVANSKP